MKDEQIHQAIDIVKKEIKEVEGAIVDKIAKETRSPFKILISTLISSRTKDKVTKEASDNLFAIASSPQEMLALSKQEIQDLIYPAGFYRNKSEYIKQTSQILLDDYDGQVPDTIPELVDLPGVGRKTANLVVTLAFDKPGICVDTHVHRITNRWGYIATNKPSKTEEQLRKKLPREYWKPINNLLVTYGKNICTPQSPYCSSCKLTDLCDQVDVDQHR